MDWSWLWRRQEWQPVSRAALVAWLVFYALFFWHALTSRSGFLLIDYVNLIIHEAGHFFFSWFGYTLTILGGSLAELLVPFLIAFYFYRRGHTAAVAFSACWFFENFLYIGRYMADARAQLLPLVGSGDHDWEILFSQWGLLMLDRRIGGFTLTLGWLGMLGTLAWLIWTSRRGEARTERSHKLPGYWNEDGS